MTALAAAQRGVLTIACLLASSALAQTTDSRRSGFDDMSPQSQALQKDDTANPGMLWVLDGEALWIAKAGGAGKSCADCHQDAATSMKGVAARYPAFSAEHNRPLDLQGRINACREAKQQATPFAWESKELLALSAYVGKQSRGLPIAPPDDPRLEPFRKRGEALYSQRVGQLNFSCANCHDDNAGPKPVCLRCAGVCGARAVHDVARERDAGRDAGGEAVMPCSPDGAKRNPGLSQRSGFPDCASRQPGDASKLLHLLPRRVELRQVGDQVRDLLRVLDAGERHLGAGDLAPGVDDVFAERRLVPGDVRLLVGI
jgi:hypothetical protein